MVPSGRRPGARVARLIGIIRKVGGRLISNRRLAGQLVLEMLTMRCSGFLAVFILLASAPANADLVAYEGFDYGNASLGGQSGGFGFAEGWSDVVNTAATATGDVLNGPYPGLTTSGGHGYMGTSNRTGRTLATSSNSGGFGAFLDTNSNIGADNTTLYLSYTFRYGSTNPFWAMELHRDGTGDGNRILQIGQADSGDGVELRANNDSGTDKQLDSSPDTAAHFVVLRFDFGAAGDNLRVFYDPTIGPSTEPATPTAEYLASAGLDLSFDRVSFASFNGNGAFLDFDEIRVGTSFASVAAVPEASAYLCMGLVGVISGVVTMRRRRAGSKPAASTVA